LPAIIAIVFSLVWFFFSNAVAKRPILAFDYGGVFYNGEYFTEKVKPNKEMKNFVSRLKRKYKTVVVTNDNSLAFESISKRFGTNKLFDKRFASSDVGYMKPDKRFYGTVLKKLKARPNDVIYIDDKAEYVQEANKLGINSITFKSVPQLANDLARLGVSVY
jgi:putative hydrolase of the HAD superfamily